MVVGSFRTVPSLMIRNVRLISLVLALWVEYQKFDIRGNFKTQLQILNNLRARLIVQFLLIGRP